MNRRWNLKGKRDRKDKEEEEETNRHIYVHILFQVFETKPRIKNRQGERINLDEVEERKRRSSRRRGRRNKSKPMYTYIYTFPSKRIDEVENE